MQRECERLRNVDGGGVGVGGGFGGIHGRLVLKRLFWAVVTSQ